MRLNFGDGQPQPCGLRQRVLQAWERESVKRGE